DGLEGLTVVNDAGFALTGRPGDGQYVETRRLVQQAMLLQEVQGEPRQARLLLLIHRRRRSFLVLRFGRADLDENDCPSLDSHHINLAMGTDIIAANDVPAEAAQKASGGAFGAGAEPPPPPRPFRRGAVHFFSLVGVSAMLLLSAAPVLARRSRRRVA